MDLGRRIKLRERAAISPLLHIRRQSWLPSVYMCVRHMDQFQIVSHTCD